MKAFRVDASVQIGKGHVMHCLTLVDCFRETGAEARFYLPRFGKDLGELVEQQCC